MPDRWVKNEYACIWRHGKRWFCIHLDSYDEAWKHWVFWTQRANNKPEECYITRNGERIDAKQ